MVFTIFKFRGAAGTARRHAILSFEYKRFLKLEFLSLHSMTGICRFIATPCPYSTLPLRAKADACTSWLIDQAANLHKVATVSHLDGNVAGVFNPSEAFQNVYIWLQPSKHVPP